MSERTAPRPTSVSFVALITRKKGSTHEQFLKHWKENHAPLVAPWAVKHGIIKYRQFHLSENADPILGKGNPAGYQVMQYDGIVEIEAPSFEAYSKAIQDPYYTNVLARDEEEFFEQKLVIFGIGTPNLVVDEGKSLILHEPID